MSCKNNYVAKILPDLDVMQIFIIILDKLFVLNDEIAEFNDFLN